jgi:hypothetical protein
LRRLKSNQKLLWQDNARAQAGNAQPVFKGFRRITNHHLDEIVAQVFGTASVRPFPHRLRVRRSKLFGFEARDTAGLEVCATFF